MKTSLFTAGAALALLALTACGQQPEQAGAAPSSTPASTTAQPTTTPSATPGTSVPPTTAPTGAPTGTAVPPDFKELPPGQVESKSLPEEYTERRVWASPDGKTLQLIGLARDSCGGVEGEVLEFSASTVRIGLRPMAQPQGGPESQACAMVITPRPVVVPLREALGNRTVVVIEG
ncbi:hypothetical protein SAMN05192558_10348 [Actinokineospora alba]|uniref:Uncharacterized protein n=1 Tax=Actinokineospora alba TaxID=504798 RepID=A0A1H0JE23_9PSEU|nr:hypothetical protein [Actinokineospora alba]TDP68329.1 hypothetical protein C8E96_3894 [Actinokineospora alba]SDH76773.1 hypothetical protein SAMN05421871_1025 [Actinokineospora alba]SDO41842.1 hypothetical protein SAMN05192558_10348 [Actinokineospora alba]